MELLEVPACVLHQAEIGSLVSEMKYIEYPRMCTVRVRVKFFPRHTTLKLLQQEVQRTLVILRTSGTHNPDGPRSRVLEFVMIYLRETDLRRIINFVSEISVYGAVPDWCQELVERFTVRFSCGKGDLVA